jgi:hypothetical protein
VRTVEPPSPIHHRRRAASPCADCGAALRARESAPRPIMHRPSLLPPALGGLILLVPTLTHACDSCGCHMPSDLTPDATGWNVGLFEQYTDFGTVRDEGTKVANTYDQYMHSYTTQLIVGYRVYDWLAVNAFVPYISRSYSRPDSGVQQTGTVSGVGDSTVMSSMRFVNVNTMDHAFTASVLLGIKVPTGNPSELKYEYAETQGVTLPGDDIDPNNYTGGHDLALGSGATDYIGGVSGSYRLQDWYVTAQATYEYNTEGAYTYRYANEIAASGSIGYFFYVRSPWRAWAQVNLDGDSKGLDTVADQQTTDTANHNLYIGPEVSVMWNRKLIVDASVDIPIEEHDSAVQMDPTWRSRLSLSYRF